LVKAQVHALAQNYQLLEEVTGENRLPALEPWPVEFDLTWKSVAEKAKELVRAWNLGARPAACLHEILEEKRHIKIVSYDLREAGSALTAEGGFGYIVALNATEAPWRKNFSLAHELFHLLSKNRFPLDEIHRDLIGESSEKPKYERYADTFAATLLMPDKDVIRELENRLIDDNRVEWVDLVGIAMEFGVSTEAMLWRLKRLGRLKAEQVEQLLESAKFRGIDKSTRTGKKGSGLEFSRRMVWLGLKALRLGKISKGKFCQIFKTTRADFVVWRSRIR
jgi:Zn-dependent peptidase ImmA (M78 family)